MSTTTISPDAEAFIAAVSTPLERDHIWVEWRSGNLKPAEEHAKRQLSVRHRAKVITGIFWPNQRPDINGNIRPPAIGEWLAFPYISFGNGVEWVHLHTVYGSVTDQHYVDGRPVPKEIFDMYRPASVRHRAEHFPGNTLVVRMDKVTIL